MPSIETVSSTLKSETKKILTFQPLPRRPGGQRPGQHRGGQEPPESGHERNRDRGLAEALPAHLARPPGGGDADRRGQRGRPEELEAGDREGEQGHVVRAHGPAPAEKAHGRHGDVRRREKKERKKENEMPPPAVDVVVDRQKNEIFLFSHLARPCELSPEEKKEKRKRFFFFFFTFLDSLSHHPLTQRTKPE